MRKQNILQKIRRVCNNYSITKKKSSLNRKNLQKYLFRRKKMHNFASEKVKSKEYDYNCKHLVVAKLKVQIIVRSKPRTYEFAKRLVVLTAGLFK